MSLHSMQFFCYRGLATWRPRSAFMRALMSSCWQPIRSERSVIFLVLCPYSSLCQPFLSYELFLCLPFSFPGSQQSQPVWHRCCPHWPLLFCDPWSGSGLGQWHHDTGEPWRMCQEVYQQGLLCSPTPTPPMYLFTSVICSQGCYSFFVSALCFSPP